MSKEEARKKFLEIAIPVLKSKGVPTENEEKVSKSSKIINIFLRKNYTKNVFRNKLKLVNKKKSLNNKKEILLNKKKKNINK